VLSTILIPDLRTGREHRLDVPGVILASAALVAICYGLVEGQRYNWGKINSVLSIPLLIGGGVVLLAVFLIVQARTQDREPLVPFSLFRDRNFTLMNGLSATISIGMMGIFLPLTIYFQSDLGFTALKAGLTMAPASLVSMFVAPVAGRMSDRIGGKYILITGLTLFAAGMGWTALIAGPSSRWYAFLPALIVAGVGLGCTFAPMTTVALRNVDPRMAGAASGMLNTVRQVGSVIGTAAIGALLQSQLASALTTEAARRSTALPPAQRARFVAGFANSARSGLQVGTGQTGAKLPAGTPPALAAQLGRVSREVFSQGFVHALHTTMIMPIAVLALGAVTCLGIKQIRKSAAPGPDAPGGAAGPSAEQQPATAS
jgi:nitrate/nitrite transporter NarK